MGKNKKGDMIFLQITQQMASLRLLLLKLSDDQYAYKIKHLGNASIGEHTRHIIELMLCLLNGYPHGKVDYFNRTRNLVLEKDRLLAFSILQQLEQDIKIPDKELLMVVDQAEMNQGLEVKSTYYREVVYNTEHAIHHLALIKVAIIEMDLDIVDKYFGMAYSTIHYKERLVND